MSNADLALLPTLALQLAVRLDAYAAEMRALAAADSKVVPPATARESLSAMGELARQVPHLWREWGRFIVAHSDFALHRVRASGSQVPGSKLVALEECIDSLTSQAIRWAVVEDHPFPVALEVAQAFLEWEAARKVVFDLRLACSGDLELQRAWRLKCAAALGRAARRLHGAEEDIAIIDDESMVATALARMLRAEGFEASIYDSCATFLEEAGERAWGCALVDIVTPRPDGLELLALLGTGRRFPVVTISGLSSQELEQRARSLGAAAHLRKPVDAEALVLALSAAMARHAQAL